MSTPLAVTGPNGQQASILFSKNFIKDDVFGINFSQKFIMGGTAGTKRKYTLATMQAK